MKKEFQKSISLTTEGNSFYTLTAFKVDNSFHYFLYGYIINNKLRLYYYKYDSTDNSHNSRASAEITDKLLSNGTYTNIDKEKRIKL